MSARRPAPRSHVAVKDGVIVHQAPNNSAWTVAVRDVILIGEYTTDAGPFADDYFLVFVTGSGDQYIASFYSDGRDDLLSELGRILDAELSLGLCNSTDYTSRIIWPIRLQEDPLYEFVQAKDKRGFARIKALLSGRIDMHWSQSAREILGDAAVE